jgi:hypothetical protein
MENLEKAKGETLILLWESLILQSYLDPGYEIIKRNEIRRELIKRLERLRQLEEEVTKRE